MSEKRAPYNTAVTQPETVELRLTGTPTNVQHLAAWLQSQGLEAQHEGGDYPNKDGDGIQRYLTVKVPSREKGVEPKGKVRSFLSRPLLLVLNSIRKRKSS